MSIDESVSVGANWERKRFGRLWFWSGEIMLVPFLQS